MLRRLGSPSWRAAVVAELRVGPKAFLRTLPWLVRTRLGRVESLLQVVLEHAKSAPRQLALEMDDQRLNWSQLADASSRVAHVLAAAGVRPGDVVALLGQNSPFYVAAVLGGSRVGATVALINTHLRGRPLSHAIRVAGAKVLMVEQTLEVRVRECDDLGDQLDQVMAFGGGAMDSRLAEAPSTPYPPATVQPDDDFVYIYTSGTTGLPKPCRVSHARSILAGAGFGPLIFEFRPGDKLYCVLPLYHASALLLGASAAIIGQVPMAMRASFSASAFWDDVHRYQATAILYIGELCRYLVNTPPHPKERPNPVRVAVGNGLRPDVWPTFQKRFGIPQIREFYGATEAPGFIMNLSGKQGSVGRVPFGGMGWLELVRYDVQRDEHPKDARGFCMRCEDSEAGELLIRLPDLSPAGLEFRGYTDPEATQKKILCDVFEEGDQYFRSGDLLRRDADGFYYFVDRIGDTFRWKGENVSTAEVADVIGEHEAVLEATVVGVAVPHMEGQTGLAAVVPVGEFKPEALWQAVQELPSYARPRFVRVMSQALSTTGTFKVQKSQLQREGINPSNVSDPLYVLTETGYIPFTAEQWTTLVQGELPL